MAKGHITEEWYNKCEENHRNNYPIWWDKMAKEWNSGEYDSHMWLVGSSSYYVRLKETSWLVDPVWLVSGVFDAISNRMKEDLKSLDFIMLTHEHGDHFAPDQLNKLRDLPIKWVVPWCMEELVKNAGIPLENCIIMNPGDITEIKGVKIEAFLGHHHYPEGGWAPESLMYTVESAERKLFFSADLRDFDPKYIPQSKHFDAVFMHIYMFKGDEGDYPYTTYYPLAVNYAASLDTNLLFLGHMYGFQCGHPDNIWNYMHAGMIQDGMFCLRPDMEVIAPKVGRRYSIG